MPSQPLGSSPLGQPTGLRDAVRAWFKLLFGHVPGLVGLPPRVREALIRPGRVWQAASGTAITTAGHPGASTFFVLGGWVVAGLAAGGGEYRTLSSMGPGDIFGEIAALTGSARTANVVADEDMTALEVRGGQWGPGEPTCGTGGANGCSLRA